MFVTFDIISEDSPSPVGLTQSGSHIVFDIKIDFIQKAQWMKDGHRIPKPLKSIYTGVVSCESIS